MRYLVSSSQMKEIDRYTMDEIGIPSMVLMERAALAVAQEADRAAGGAGTVLAACGPGNNGADAAAAARILKEKGYSVTVVVAGKEDRGTQERKNQLAIARNLGMDVVEFSDFIPGQYDVVIDGGFGVGLNRPVEGYYREFLEFLKKIKSGYTVAVDLPSGVDSDRGTILGPVRKADVTVTFGYEKLGTAVYPGKAYRGRLVVADAGFPGQAFDYAGASAVTYEEEDRERLPARPAYSHKGTYGKVLVIGGRNHMAGAAYLAGLSAYRIGAGLVKFLAPESNREILQTLLPEAVMVPYGEEGESEIPDISQITEDGTLEQLCKEASAVILGPGLGRDEMAAKLVKSVLNLACSPVVLDADGLYAVAEHKEFTRYFTENIIITPHLLEMARLMDIPVEQIQGNLIQTASDYAEQYGITCVLKDAATVVAGKDGNLYINSSGCAAMAKGGAGDVLSGVIGGLLAQGMDEAEAAFLGVYLHGKAGEKAAESQGDRAVLARDLADCR